MDEEMRMDASLEQTLKDFRANAYAWSETACNQPHKPAKVYTTSWRITASWALGCLLAVGSVAGGLYERHHVKEQARIAAVEAGRQKQLEDAQRKESEDLLAKVDSDVSRDVPSAMEPLAQLMADDYAQ